MDGSSGTTAGIVHNQIDVQLLKRSDEVLNETGSYLHPLVTIPGQSVLPSWIMERAQLKNHHSKNSGQHPA